MFQMVFGRRRDGSVAPRTPMERDGSPRTPDGVRTFGLGQAVEEFRMSEADLVALYEEFYGDMFPALHDGEVGTFEADPARSAQLRRALLRAVRFSHLNDDEFGAVMDVCMSRGLDAWRHVWAESRVDLQTGKRELKIIITIDALRAMADDTGRYRGPVGPFYLDAAGEWHKWVWTDKANPPVAARVGIRRAGFKHPVWAVAEWASYVQNVETPRGLEVSDFWLRSGAPQLGKCAEALALKKAFPKALGSLLTREEMDQAQNPPAPRSPHQRTSHAGGDDDIAGDTPVTWREFEGVLADRFGVNTPPARQAVIAKLREQIPGAGAAVPKTFFAQAIRALDRTPEAFGVALMEPA